MEKYFYAIEHTNGHRTFGSILAATFNDAFDTIYRKGANILSLSTSQANVAEDVYCQDHDC